MPAFDFDPGTVIADRYELVAPLGQGAFGHTILARDRVAGHDVALKLLDAGADWKARELFAREAAVLRGLRHAGVPRVHDFLQATWRDAPADLLIMEYIEGTSLAQLIASRATVSRGDAFHLFLELLGILDYLHGLAPPVLHRDIKPANIIVRPSGAPVLVDFGSVRHLFLGPDEAGSTVAGTYGYMPYEQYMGQASPRSDLYALGATFLHLLTGRAPRDFMADDGRLRVPDALPGDPRLAPVIRRLLEPSPAERFARARAARDALLAPSPQYAVAPPAAETAGPPRANPVQHPFPDVFGEATPRALRGELAAAFERTAPNAWSYFDTGAKPTDPVGIMDWLALGLATLFTAGVYPIVMTSMARARRRRVKTFFEMGHLVQAEVLSLAKEEVAFREAMIHVAYQFFADGQWRRDTDDILPIYGWKLQPGDHIPILYRPDQNYDSVVILSP